MIKKLRYNVEAIDRSVVRLVIVPLTVAALAIVSPAIAAVKSPLFITKLEGPSRAQAVTGPVTLIFWRGDCGPCLTELRDLRDLARASGETPILAVGLDTSDNLKRGAEKAGLNTRLLWRSNVDPQTTLASYGGLPARLPLAVSLNAAGQVCALHHGLLGEDRVRDWARARQANVC